MPIPFERFQLIYPPRPGSKIHPRFLKSSKYAGYVAQYKYHDVRTLVYFFPDGQVELFNRRLTPHGTYQMTPQMRTSLDQLKLRRGYYHVLDGGLMHSMTRNVKDRIILWDVLVHQGSYLLGTTYLERYELLRKLVGSPRAHEKDTGHGIALKINRNLWLAPLFKKDLPKHFEKLLHLDEIEGLVLKDPKGKLTFGGTEENNGRWQIRCRKPRHDYEY